MVQTSVREAEFGLLCSQLSELAEGFVSDAQSSAGDFAKVEAAGAALIAKLRPLVMGCGVRVSAAASTTAYRCPDCGRWLDRWGYKDRSVMTSQGAARYRSVRYRCRSCARNHYPLEDRNGLVGQRFTLGARGAIAALSAETAFATTAHLAAVMGIDVSPSEVDRVAREVSTWREEEECDAVVRYRAAEEKRHGSDEPRLFRRLDSPDATVALLSVDGVKVRSPETSGGDTGWFEAREAVIAQYNREGKQVGRTLYMGGVRSLDDTFALLAAAVRDAVPKHLALTFVSDDGGGLNERARMHFADAVHTLDVYHAGEHVGSAGVACYGDQSAEAAAWRRKARTMLMTDDCARTVLKALIGALRTPDSVVDPQALSREFRYLWRNRHRMRYRSLLAQGMPISSAAMESGVKQACTQRLRQPGMMWTRQGSDAMLRLRSAHLSQQLTATLEGVALRYAKAARRYDTAKHTTMH